MLKPSRFLGPVIPIYFAKAERRGDGTSVGGNNELEVTSITLTITLIISHFSFLISHTPKVCLSFLKRRPATSERLNTAIDIGMPSPEFQAAAKAAKQLKAKPTDTELLQVPLSFFDPLPLFPKQYLSPLLEYG